MAGECGIILVRLSIAVSSMLSCLFKHRRDPGKPDAKEMKMATPSYLAGMRNAKMKVFMPKGERSI